MARTEFTDILLEARAGPDVLDRLLPIVYDELRRVAHAHLAREPAGHTLDTTALVHETYLKLADLTRLEWHDRTHFFAVASRAMRRILVDYARRRLAVKRGGALRRVELDVAQASIDEDAHRLLALDEALARLAALCERPARVVECRFFGGLSEEETAAVLGVTARTVRRDWVKARGWLYRELGGALP